VRGTRRASWTDTSWGGSPLSEVAHPPLPDLILWLHYGILVVVVEVEDSGRNQKGSFPTWH
jgi:hypothetical protein